MKPKKTKPPVIRPGQTKPFKKPTQEQIDARTEEAVALLARYQTKSQIRKHFKQKHDVEWQTADDYVRRARERMLERVGAGREVLRAQSLSVYTSIVESAKDGRIKTLAQERIDRLMGLESPRMIGHGGAPMLPPIKTESEDTLEVKLPKVSKARLAEIIASTAEILEEKEAEPNEKS